jgi:glutamyl-tRNA reductase
MSLKILGLNHSTAPVEIREQVIYTGDDVARALAAVVTLDDVREAVVLSTCNRTEFYVAAGDRGASELERWLISDQNLGAEAAAALFALDGDNAIQHLFRVACGLESMVLGEPQILGQLKDAFRDAEGHETVGPSLTRLFHHTFSVAKKVRTDTEIGNSPVSVASAAVNLANQFFSGFGQHTAVLIGAGATIELVAKHLVGKGIGRLFVANRDITRAQALAGEVGGYALPLSELDGTLEEADILISSTASPNIIVTREQMTKAVKARKRRPIFAVDIAVPRDLDPKISELNDVYLYTIDDLDKVILDGQSNREAAVGDANRILDTETQRYLEIQRSKVVAPVITALRDHGDSVRDEVLQQGLRRLRKGSDHNEVLEYVTGSLLKKLLHQPSVRLREAGEKSDEEFIAMARELFGLNDDKE